MTATLPERLRPDTHSTHREERSERTSEISPRASEGLATGTWLLVAATTGIGLLIVTLAFVLSRMQISGGLELFWFGIMLIVLPPALAVAYGRPRRHEAAALVVLLGAGLYVVKVMHSPFQFVFADELSHYANLQYILATGHLPTYNASIPVTTRFPGLETLTAGFASTAHVSGFVAGLVVIGIARCVLQLGLFVFFSRISGSNRIGALAATCFVFDPEYLYWSAQFSYESLALPLAVVVLVAALNRSRGHFPNDRREARPWTGVGMLGIAAVTVTHHMTSYLLCASLIVLAFLSFASDRREWRAPWDLAVFSLLAALAWYAFRASLTGAYLHEIFDAAYSSARSILNGSELPRKPFQSTIYHIPLAERAVAVVGLGVIFAIVVFARVRRRRRVFRDPFVRLLWLACCGYLLSYGARFIPSAWEIADRASEFLLIGTSLVVALSGINLVLAHRFGRRFGPTLFAVAFGLCFASGVIGGWPPPALLASPLKVAVGSTTIEPQGFTAAEWARQTLPAGSAMIADESNGRLLLTIAHERPSIGLGPPTRLLIQSTTFSPYALSLLRAEHTKYVLIDRRKIANDNIVGYFFDRDDKPILEIPSGVWEKFDEVPWAERVYDSGDILIYRLGKVPNADGS
jgi:hypothetical protein